MYDCDSSLVAHSSMTVDWWQYCMTVYDCKLQYMTGIHKYKYFKFDWIIYITHQIYQILGKCDTSENNCKILSEKAA